MNSDNETDESNIRDNHLLCERAASEAIGTILDFMFNRHIHKLKENGYLNENEYDVDYGYVGDSPKKALSMKQELIREAQSKFSAPIARKIVSADKE